MPKRPVAALATLLVVGTAGVALTSSSEGLRTSAYLDPVGKPTICYGHTGPEVRLGLRYTAAQCEQLLISDLRIAHQGMARCIQVPVNQNQSDALGDFFLNLGATKACSSTLVRKLNAHSYSGAASEFPKWKYGRVNGRVVVLHGLAKRRTAEQRLFLSTAPSSVSRLAMAKSLTLSSD